MVPATRGTLSWARAPTHFAYGLTVCNDELIAGGYFATVGGAGWSVGGTDSRIGEEHCRIKWSPVQT
jgi:hypothetical protein